MRLQIDVWLDGRQAGIAEGIAEGETKAAEAIAAWLERHNIEIDRDDGRARRRLAPTKNIIGELAAMVRRGDWKPTAEESTDGE